MIRNYLRYIALSGIVIFFTWSNTSFVSAQSSQCPSGVKGGLQCIGTPFGGRTILGGPDDPWTVVVGNIINVALGIAGIAAVLVIIYGGFLYITSRGNETQAKTGRNALTYALIGLVIIILSYMIVNVLVNFLTNN